MVWDRFGYLGGHHGLVGESEDQLCNTGRVMVGLGFFQQGRGSVARACTPSISNLQIDDRQASFPLTMPQGVPFFASKEQNTSCRENLPF